MAKLSKLKKGFISFFALIIVFIVSLFTVNCMGLTHSNTTALYVKRAIEKSCLIAAYAVDGELDEDGEMVYEELNTSLAAYSFFDLLGRNIGLDGLAPYEAIRQYKGKNVIFQYRGYQNIDTTGCILTKTPKVWVGIFKPEELTYNTGGSKTEKTEEFISTLYNIIASTTFVENSDLNNIIKIQIINQLDITRDGKSSVINDTRPVIFAFAEIPTDSSAFGVDTMYRFAIARVKIDKCEHKYVEYQDEYGRWLEAPCSEICLICGKSRAVDLHTTAKPCQQQCIYCKEIITSTTDHYIKGQAAPVVGFEEHVITGESSCIAVSMCSVCNQIIPANGHQYSSYIKTQDATCTLNEIATATCLTCGGTKEKVTGIALGHDYQEATCSRPSFCSRCKLETGVKKEHTLTAWATQTNASCYNDGKRVRNCSVAGCYWSTGGYSGVALSAQNIATLQSEAYLFEGVIVSQGHVWGTSTLSNIATNIKSEKQSCMNCSAYRQRQVNTVDSTQTTEWVVFD